MFSVLQIITCSLWEGIIYVCIGSMIIEFLVAVTFSLIMVNHNKHKSTCIWMNISILNPLAYCYCGLMLYIWSKKWTVNKTSETVVGGFTHGRQGIYKYVYGSIHVESCGEQHSKSHLNFVLVVGSKPSSNVWSIFFLQHPCVKKHVEKYRSVSGSAFTDKSQKDWFQKLVFFRSQHRWSLFSFVQDF